MGDRRDIKKRVHRQNDDSPKQAVFAGLVVGAYRWCYQALFGIVLAGIHFVPEDGASDLEEVRKACFLKGGWAFGWCDGMESVSSWNLGVRTALVSDVTAFATPLSAGLFTTLFLVVTRIVRKKLSRDADQAWLALGAQVVFGLLFGGFRGAPVGSVVDLASWYFGLALCVGFAPYVQGRHPMLTAALGGVFVTTWHIAMGGQPINPGFYLEYRWGATIASVPFWIDSVIRASIVIGICARASVKLLQHPSTSEEPAQAPPPVA